MSKLLEQIKAINNAIARPTPPQIEPRSVRRKKARDAAKASQTKRSRPASNNLVNQK